MERATQAANFGSFMHQGQICMSVEKVLVHEKIFDHFLKRFVERAKLLKVGDPTKNKEHIIGPLINDKQVGKVREQLEDAIAKGAKVVLGGKIEGRFVEPTILTGVTPDMKLYQDETFGPVVPVIPFRTDDEAIQIANDTEYGLSAGVMTRDEARGLAIVNRLDTGNCHINCSSVNDEPHVPFGGFKASGVGKHGGRWSLETFTETRWITLDRGGRPLSADVLPRPEHAAIRWRCWVGGGQQWSAATPRAGQASSGRNSPARIATHERRQGPAPRAPHSRDRRPAGDERRRAWRSFPHCAQFVR